MSGITLEPAPESLPSGMSPMIRVWGSIVISVMIVGGFMTLVVLIMLRPIPAGSETLVNVVFGTLGSLAVLVGNYWLGSSAGSASKDAKK